MDAYQIKTTPDPLEPYLIAQGYRVGGLIFLSGQAAIDDDGNLVGVNDFQKQVAQTFANIAKLLESSGSGLSKIIKVTIYVTDMGRFPDIIEMRRQYFTPPYPADTVVEVRSLALPELLIEVDVTALADGKIVAAAGGLA
ncbi:RidA family protein [Rhizorhabdus wittichii]|uniref:RidA family protein n=1 Tax=Rhizorhabdus wittichii TaxID=160791 RepID=A0A975HCE1_9SPHN|nr:RidA family protein [Rhizorhabdus wittichii]QTH20158.1 RidA family protein [Rhizorhabdus wittichii]